MWHKNQFGLEPGTYRHKGTGEIMVVSEITNYQYNAENNMMGEVTDPIVTYRDLIPSAEKYITYGMALSVFKEKFIKE